MFQQDDKQESGINAFSKKLLQSKSKEELKRELDLMFEQEEKTGQKVNPEQVTKYYEALGENEFPQQLPGDFELSWEKFVKDHPQQFPKAEAKSHGQLIQVMRMIEVAILAAILLMVSAMATNWPDYIVHWGKELFGMSPAPSGTMELVEPNINGYSSLDGATVGIGVPDVLLPQWIPAEYEIQDIITQDSIFYATAVATYTATDKELTIRVAYYPDAEDMPSLAYEKNDDGKQTVYTQGGTEHYLIYNFERLQAVWKNGHCICSISGDVSKSEIERMINSIYGG